MNHTTQIPRLVITIIFFFCFVGTKSHAQDSLHYLPMSNIGSYPHTGCGLDEHYLLGAIVSSPPTPSLAPTYFSASAIDTCGKIAVYYEDINSGTVSGFADTTLVGGITKGQIRRNTLCQVLSYIQSTFDFSNIDSSDLLRIHVQLSYGPGNPAPFGMKFFASASPIYATTPNTVIGGFFNDYVMTGTDPAMDYHALMIVNFDSIFNGYGMQPINYLEDPSATFSGCKIDLMSLLLHEIGHAMGFFSLVKFHPTSLTCTGMHPIGNATNTYTRVDSSIYAGSIYPTLSLTKLITGTSGSSLAVNSSSAVDANGNYWISNKAAPDNHPVFSSQLDPLECDTVFVHSYISHLDDFPVHYRTRSHISPGEQPEYVMAPLLLDGVRRRTYTNGEIRIFTEVLGYTYLGASSLTANHVPFSTKMANYDLANLFPVITETATPDFTITNNGTPLVIHLDSLADLSDVDGDTIRVDTNTVTNFRGCGDGGNNHNQLALSAGNTIITYTPRNDFMGKAQFGFNLTDGKEDGSYYVITVDVKQGTYPAYTAGTNMVLNPNFESGTEMKVAGADETKANSLKFENGYHEGKWQASSFSDCHPYSIYGHLTYPYGCGVAVKNSNLLCSFSLSGQYEGTQGTSFPSFDVHLLDSLGGNRYQTFDGAGNFSYYYLAANTTTCQYYTLEFDMYARLGTSPQDISLKIGFKDSTSPFLAPVFNYIFKDTVTNVSPTSWKHVTVPFYYCGSPSNILYIQALDNSFAVDNFSLIPSTLPPPPLVAHIAEIPISGCRDSLFAIVSDTICSIAYSWNTIAGTILSSNSDSSSITVPLNTVATYTVTVNDGCRTAFDTITVIDTVVPAPITGVTDICAGSVSVLSDGTINGSWSSSDTLIATVDSLTGIVSGISPGTAIITYRFCTYYDTAIVTISPTPPPITGDTVLCLGSTITLANDSAGGTWTSSDLAMGTIDASGVLTGIAAGPLTISYSFTPACYITYAVLVDTLPVLGPITTSGVLFDTMQICVGGYGTMDYMYYMYPPASSFLGMGNWTSSDTTIASIPAATGVYAVNVWGIAPGFATITYTVNRCGSATTTATILVNPLPASISGVPMVCPGYVTSLACADTGGTWSSNDVSVADFANPHIGNVSGIATGTAIITYSLPSGCYTTIILTVNSVIYTITGTSEVCVGSTTTLTAPSGGGTWSSDDVSIATVGTSGDVTGIAAGLTTISYALGAGCTSVTGFTVNPLPASITGTLVVCIGSQTLLSNTISGGTWSSSNTAVASIGTDGTVTGINVGTAAITYTLSTGCNTTAIATVFPLPAVITGTLNVCAGSTTPLSDATPGGTWSSSDASICSIGTGGLASGGAAGVATITYILSTGCFVTADITVNSLPAIISGTLVVCKGSTTPLSDATTGGTWTSSNTAIATIDGSGVVTGIDAGTAIITYTITATGCYQLATATVNPLPAAIIGTLTVCKGLTTPLSDATLGGTWTSSTSSVATVDGSGVVTGVDVGTSIITYTITATGCYTTVTATVHPLPAVITGTFSLCQGATTTLSSATSGGNWNSSNMAVGTISTAGMVTAISAGTTVITYNLLSTGCYVTEVITVNALPALISGVFKVCEGATTTLSSFPLGGIWSSSAPSIADVGSSSGVVAGVIAGTSTITYALGTGCYRTETVTVNPQPAPISGGSLVCEGLNITLSDPTLGGVWSSALPTIGTIDATSGVVTGIAPGYFSINYTLPAGCFSVKYLTVNPTPVISGSTYIICTGNNVTLGSSLPGCTWSSSNITVATIGSTSGVVNGGSAGTAVITCLAANGCYSTITVTVNTSPALITGVTEVCVSSSVTLSDVTPGGTWSSVNAAIATVGSSTGVVSGVSAGTVAIEYILTSTGCSSSLTITVDPLPTPITGILSICPGTTTNLSTTPSGGVWISSVTAVGTVGYTSGVVTGIASGTTDITYTLPTGCLRFVEATVNPLPSGITGSLTVCVDNTTALSSATSGGTWSSSNTAVGTINPSGVLEGISTGTTRITYTLPTGCYVTAIVSVDPLAPITGIDSVCVGSTVTLACATTGGTWASSTPAIGTVGSSTGIVAGIAVGTTDITYTISSTCRRSRIVTVRPTAAPITGNNAICYGSSGITLSNPTTGGTWSCSPASVATIGASGTLVAVNPGPYPYSYSSGSIATITYTTGPGCYRTYPVSVFHDDKDCSPCHVGQFGTTHDFNTVGLSGTFDNPWLTGNYYIPNSASITVDVVATDAVIFIDPGVLLSVTPYNSFTSNGSHLFSCPSHMWKGIELLRSTATSAGATARIVLQGNTGGTSGQSTLIEDAEIAVKVDNPGAPNSGGLYFIESYNTIFNRNSTGISVTNDTLTTSSLSGTPYLYEFLIENTTFTGKDLAITGYPFAWPGNYGTGGLKNTISVSTVYESPYNITTYTTANCHNGTVPYSGISLNNVGKTTGPYYAGVQIGEPATPPVLYPPFVPEWNLFDGLAYGINANNANLTVRNNVFQNSRHVFTGGAPAPFYPLDKVGIYTNVDNAKKYQLTVVPVTSGSGIYYTVAPNLFYDCNVGVYSNDYNIVNCQQSDIRSRQVYSTDGNSHYGFIVSSSAYEDIQIKENSIFNMANGISFASSFTPGYLSSGGGFSVWHPEEQRLGNLDISANTIQAAVGTVTPTPGLQYLSFGIAVQNVLPNGGSIIPVGTANTNYNHIRDANRGILVSGYQTQVANTVSNDITVMPNGTQKCWGINHTYNKLSNVVENNVNSGVSINDATMYDNDSVRAYLMESNSSPYVGCNYANNTWRGYEFYSFNAGTRWKNNQMEHHGKGMLLNFSYIGAQGTTSDPYNNEWIDTTWWSGSSGRYQTFCIDTPGGFASPLYVRNLAVTNPTENWGFPTFVRYFSTGSTQGIFTASGLGLSDCPIEYIDHVASRAGSYDPNVRDELAYGTFPDPRSWLAQFITWETVLQDTVLTDSSAVLAQFKTMAAGSRFAYLTDIEQMITDGDITSALAQLATTPTPLSPSLCYDSVTGVRIKDDSTIDYIINTHKDFYNIYLRYIQNTMDSTDSVQIPYIAQLCPLEYGPVVYKARALYTVVFNDLRVWCEGCDQSQGQGEGGQQRPALIRPLTDSKQGQLYSLHPNPNDGNIILTQTIDDKGTVLIDVTDMLGRSVYKNEVLFNENKYKLNLDKIAPGLYVANIIDSKGRKYIFKFVKE